MYVKNDVRSINAISAAGYDYLAKSKLQPLERPTIYDVRDAVEKKRLELPGLA